MAQQEFRCGVGYDLHRLEPGRKLILGGVEIPFDKGLAGHSDADILMPALTDALLGAAGLGDVATPARYVATRPCCGSWVSRYKTPPRIPASLVPSNTRTRWSNARSKGTGGDCPASASFSARDARCPG